MCNFLGSKSCGSIILYYSIHARSISNEAYCYLLSSLVLVLVLVVLVLVLVVLVLVLVLVVLVQQSCQHSLDLKSLLLHLPKLTFIHNYEIHNQDKWYTLFGTANSRSSNVRVVSPVEENIVLTPSE